MSALPAIMLPRASAANRVHLFVSTALDSWSTDQGSAFARDVQIDDTAYRQLDPQYYAWLRSRMLLAQEASSAGHLEPAAFEDLRIRFNAVHDWAVQHFGEEQLRAAVRAIRSSEYKPPVAEDDSPPPSAPTVRKAVGSPISPEAIATVDAIAGSAMALGWSRERLYAAGKGIFDPQRGLVSYLKPGDRIGEVTVQSIEIIHLLPSEVRHRFYNPDVDQPWIVRTHGDKKVNPGVHSF